MVYCKDCGAEISRKTVTVPALPEEKKEEAKETENVFTGCGVDPQPVFSAHGNIGMEGRPLVTAGPVFLLFFID